MAGEAIFIGYRRDDSSQAAGDIYSALAARVGPSLVFKDVDNIALGDDFGGHIKGILPRCRIALIIIGPNWVEATDEDGRRRLDDPFDWVRVEVELALAAAAAGDLRVVPVLVNGARMPRANDVPLSLHPLLGRNAAVVRPHPNFDNDTDRLWSSLALVIVPEMVGIPAGEFIMGLPASESGWNQKKGFASHHLLGRHPQRRVRVNAFRVGRFPVTDAEWDAANAGGARLRRPDDQGWGRDRRPVINVSWNDAQNYIAWLNSKTSGGYRLASEAEWEYACRAGTTTRFSFEGGEEHLDQHGWFKRNSGEMTHPVGDRLPNPWGLHDMYGNVYEWCEDLWHDNYSEAPSDGSAWITGDSPFRVVRGGCWKTRIEGLGSPMRGLASSPDNNIGFRVARTV